MRSAPRSPAVWVHPLLELAPVEELPATLIPGQLYYLAWRGIAAHLCPSGCGVKVVTPIGSHGWSLDIGQRGPSLWPSVLVDGSDCHAHYFVTSGAIIPAEPQYVPARPTHVLRDFFRRCMKAALRR